MSNEHTDDEHEHEGESYADEAPLTYLFGDGARVKIIGAFVSERGRDITISEAARLSGVTRATVYKHIEPLENLGVVTSTRNLGAGQRYQLNDETQLGALLYQLEGVALQRLLDVDYFE